MILDSCERLCNLTIEREDIWSKKAVAQAKKCLNIISELRLSGKSEAECFQATIHDMTILAELLAPTADRINRQAYKKDGEKWQS